MQTGCNVGIVNWKSILIAFYGNVRSILEYCSVIWGGASKCHLDRVEKVQHRFIRWLYQYTQRQPIPVDIDYYCLLRTFDIASLGSRRQQYDAMFVAKLYKGSIDSTTLLERFPLFVAPRTTRRTDRTRGILNVPYARVDTVKGSVFVRAPTVINEVMFECNDVDMFHDSLREFRKKVNKHLRRNV